MNLLLAVDASQWILFAVLLAIIVVTPFFMRLRNKKDMERSQQVINSIKKGDKILTSAGIIGNVVSVDEKDGYKTVTIETGTESQKGYLTFDIAAVYMNLSAKASTEPAVSPTEKLTAEIKEEAKSDEPQETNPVAKTSDEPQETNPVAKKSSKKKTK